MEVEDAVHTAILTLKEGFEGQLSENSIEIGILSKRPDAHVYEEGKPVKHEHLIPGKHGMIFRKLSKSEVQDYLANIA
jgi:20S proteasome subunit alpha 2